MAWNENETKKLPTTAPSIDASIAVHQLDAGMEALGVLEERLRQSHPGRRFQCERNFA